MKLKDRFVKYAQSVGVAINEESHVIKGLELSEEKCGVPMCPCIILSQNPSIVERMLARCPCSDIVNIINGDIDSCHCGLFKKLEV